MPRVNSKLLTKFETSFIINSAKLWNKMPPDLTKLTNYNQFKYKLNIFLSQIADKPPLPGYPFANHNSVLNFGWESN